MDNRSPLMQRSPTATSPIEPQARQNFAPAAADAYTVLIEAATQAAQAAQQARSLAAALEESLATLATIEPRLAAGNEERSTPSSRNPTRTDALSPREREVLALVAKGHTNKAIAEALFVSPNTVKTHIASLLGKLQAETRVQLAVLATRYATV